MDCFWANLLEAVLALVWLQHQQAPRCRFQPMDCRGVRTAPGASGKEFPMLWTIALIMLLMWGLGLISGYTMSGFIHILLVIALVAVVVRLISGRPAI